MSDPPPMPRCDVQKLDRVCGIGRLSLVFMALLLIASSILIVDRPRLPPLGSNGAARTGSRTVRQDTGRTARIGACDHCWSRIPTTSGQSVPLT
eukprot:scaffold7374_cov112-Isochrysis_galbana.AAC.23